MSEIATLEKVNTIPVNAFALMNKIGAILPESHDSIKKIEIEIHENENPIVLNTRMIQMAIADGDIELIFQKVDEAAKRVAAGVDVNTKTGAATLKTLATKVTKAKSIIKDHADEMKKSINESMAMQKNSITIINANLKNIEAIFDKCRDEVRAPLTAIEEAKKARENKIAELMADLDKMLNVYNPLTGEFTPSATLIEYQEKLKTFIPADLTTEAKLIAKFQDVEKMLPEAIKNAQLQEKKDQEAKAAIEAAKKAEAKLELAKEMHNEAINAGAGIAQNVAQSIAQANTISNADPVPTPPPAAPAKQLYTLEQRRAIFDVVMREAAIVGFTSDEDISKFKQFFNRVYQDKIEVLKIVLPESMK